jgi:type I restriction enzyme, S subunit
MPQNCKTYKLGELGTVVTGKTPSSKNPEHFGEATPFVTPTDFSYFHKHVAQTDRRLSEEGVRGLRNKLLPSNSLLVTCIGSQMGKVVVNRMPVVTNQQLNAIVPFEFVDADYLYYKLLTLHDSLKTMAGGGSTMPLLNKTDFENIEVTIPSLSEQQSIASILSALDDKIELNLATNRTLEQMAMAIYKHWFVDFGPFQGGNFIESELGLIPEGWEVKRLGDITEALSKGTTPTKSDVDGLEVEVPFLKVKDIQEDGDIKHSGIEKIPRSVHQNQLKRSILQTDDILFSIAGTIGRVSTVPESLNGSNCNQALAFVRLKQKQAHLAQIYFWLKSESTQRDVTSSIVQGVQANVSLTVLRDLQFSQPISDVMDHFNNEIVPLMNLIFTNRVENQTLTTLRDTLLPKLISGAVRVKDAERTVAHAL